MNPINLTQTFIDNTPNYLPPPMPEREKMILLLMDKYSVEVYEQGYSDCEATRKEVAYQDLLDGMDMEELSIEYGERIGHELPL